MREARFSQYDIDYISGVMSLRKPQKESLEILESILNDVDLNSEPLENSIEKIKARCPKFSDFEREFISLTFALATGVGKTRLMGTFITYLYTNYGIKNFLVIAPNTTIYEKLKKDFGDPSNPKYVFKGLGCFTKAPQMIADNDYKEKNISLFDADVKIYVFNISKLDKENVKIRAFDENLGSSFFKKLSDTKDLVMIMDESHHYRADAGFKTLNELKPILGLELTATPFVNTSKGQIPFKNVVYEYTLAKAISDGYTRTPYAITRSNIKFYNFADEQIYRLMIEDGLLCHERMKAKLLQYSQNNNKPIVKPFMMIVCQDVERAEKVFNLITSDKFHNGKYSNKKGINKTIIVHSNNKANEQEVYLKNLLEIEKSDNPTEIVIHVNMLKEGWDVNNLYTIVPLRTASSKILREQMVGRGLRLPYGNRTGEKEIDGVYLTAHDNFDDILKEAQKGDSIFKKEYFIKAEDIEPEEVVRTQLTIELDNSADKIQQICSENGINNTSEATQIVLTAQKQIQDAVEKIVSQTDDDGNAQNITEQEQEKIINDIKQTFVESEQKDLAETFADNEMPLTAWMRKTIEEVRVEVIKKFIPIPQIKVTEEGIVNYNFKDFDLDFSKMNYAPIENELIIQNLTDMAERNIVEGSHINYDAYNPGKIILELLIEKPEVDYAKSSKLIQKLILQFCTYYSEKYTDSGMKNIVMMNKIKIAEEIHKQMMQNFELEEGFIKEEVLANKKTNVPYTYNGKKQKNFFERYASDEDGNIKSIVFTGIKRGVFDTAKFDSEPELRLARILERETGFVINWLRPAPSEFNISYKCNGLHKYEPDFVVETDKIIYLVEVKRSDMVDMEDVKAKKDRAISYCKIATEWNLANGYKEWKYVFIPDSEIYETSTFQQLCKVFCVENNSEEYEEKVHYMPMVAEKSENRYE